MVFFLDVLYLCFSDSLSHEMAANVNECNVLNCPCVFEVPYSWDEPTLLPELSVGVMGSGSYTRYRMQDLGGGERLYYYNPIYVVFTHTFSR